MDTVYYGQICWFNFNLLYDFTMKSAQSLSEVLTSLYSLCISEVMRLLINNLCTASFLLELQWFERSCGICTGIDLENRGGTGVFP